MRLATAADEILPLKESSRSEEPGLPHRDPALARDHPAGRRQSDHTEDDRALFAADVSYLQDLYNELNGRVRRDAAGHLSELRDRLRPGAAELGGILGYPLDQVYEEVAFIAYHFHWDFRTIIELEH